MNGPFDVVMCDPPWPVASCITLSEKRGRQDKALPYQVTGCAAIGEMLDRDVLSQAAPAHCVFLWLVDRWLHEGFALMVDRGYKLHTRFVWAKGNGPCISTTVRRTHEYLSWFYRGRLLPVAQQARFRFGTVIEAPQRQHSRKPEAAYRLVEALYPDARKLDAFTRELRPGWDGWGNERDHFTPLLAPLREGSQ
jgi:N6-adenosine-specific RNA methylase IME4